MNEFNIIARRYRDDLQVLRNLCYAGDSWVYAVKRAHLGLPERETTPIAGPTRFVISTILDCSLTHRNGIRSLSAGSSMSSLSPAPVNEFILGSLGSI